ncbi:MAG: zinc-dependent alcohol dehydrogenase family protein [Gammaproteobacteria bacterium]
MCLAPGAQRLTAVERDMPVPGAREVLIAVSTCGVCRTDLHIVDGELPPLGHAIVPGHEIVGHIVAVGGDVTDLAPGRRVGVPWLGFSCGTCEYCASGRENLCERAEFTGYHRDGGYAEYVVADARYVFPLPDGYTDLEAAPLLCAGLIGYRSLVMAGDAPRLGLYGFGAAAHLLAQVARARGQAVYAFTRPGDTAAQAFARCYGAAWAGDSDRAPPVSLDAAIILAPVGALVPVALQAVKKGGSVVCGGIHMSDIPAFPYALLWGERRLVSVANLTRRDGLEFLALAGHTRLETRVERFALADANLALDRLRSGALSGVAVLSTGPA